MGMKSIMKMAGITMVAMFAVNRLGKQVPQVQNVFGYNKTFLESLMFWK